MASTSAESNDNSSPFEKEDFNVAKKAIEKQEDPTSPISSEVGTGKTAVLSAVLSKVQGGHGRLGLHEVRTEGSDFKVQGTSPTAPRRPRKLTLSEFLEDSPAIQKLKKEENEKRNNKRDVASNSREFESQGGNAVFTFDKTKFNNKQETIQRLRNSAPCRRILNRKKCVVPDCTFAHSEKELTPPKCLFGSECHKTNCNSIHPGETKEDWLKKMDYVDIFGHNEDFTEKVWRKKDDRVALKSKGGTASLGPHESLRDLKYKKNIPRPVDSNDCGDRLNLSDKPKLENDGNFDVPDSSPRDRVILVFPEKFVGSEIKKVLGALVDLGIDNIEIRRNQRE